MFLYTYVLLRNLVFAGCLLCVWMFYLMYSSIGIFIAKR